MLYTSDCFLLLLTKIWGAKLFIHLFSCILVWLKIFSLSSSPVSVCNTTPYTGCIEPGENWGMCCSGKVWATTVFRQLLIYLSKTRQLLIYLSKTIIDLLVTKHPPWLARNGLLCPILMVKIPLYQHQTLMKNWVNMTEYYSLEKFPSWLDYASLGIYRISVPCPCPSASSILPLYW